MRTLIGGIFASLTLAGALLAATAVAMADGMTTHYRHTAFRIHLPPGRHVIEVVQPPVAAGS